jgi:hypothetical protein
VLAAATPNVASWVAPQDGFITGVTFYVDVKTAITVLALMVEKNGTNILSAAVDLNAAAVRVTAMPAGRRHRDRKGVPVSRTTWSPWTWTP